MSRPTVAWGGLDFDTAELDVEIREVLAAISPEGSAVQALAPTATVREALSALDADTNGWPGAGTPAGQISVCLEALDRARDQLWRAHEALGLARQALR